MTATTVNEGYFNIKDMTAEIKRSTHVVLSRCKQNRTMILNLVSLNQPLFFYFCLCLFVVVLNIHILIGKCGLLTSPSDTTIAAVAMLIILLIIPENNIYGPKYFILFSCWCGAASHCQNILRSFDWLRHSNNQICVIQ